MVKKPIDGNEGVARIAYKMSDMFAIYPITPSSSMGELADEYSAKNELNIFGLRPLVMEMQSEGGAIGALHGALSTGSLACTFTCSQGLLLMIPNMYKIAGEMTPCVIHVAARAIAAQGLSIYGDQQDVMAVRQTGWAMLCSGSVQEAHDFALIAHLATLKAKVPFVHFFDGFRTSHEINKIELIDEDVIKKLIDENSILEHRNRALHPEKPTMRGTAQNIDIYFQGRESVNKYYLDVPSIVQDYFNEFEKLTKRKYKLYEYYGDNNAETVIVIMGSGSQAVKETVKALNKNSKKVGVLQVRLFRPLSGKLLANALPKSVRKVVVLDRTKEPGSIGEPLYLDVVAALKENNKESIKVFGGRYGLSSKEFTPSMINAIFNKVNNFTDITEFTIGIEDDLTKLSIKYSNDFKIDTEDVKEAIFFGLGSDGTVGANKNTIKIITDREKYFGQAYFVYDSKKSGSITESHLRFGKNPINSTYLIQEADFIGCHQFPFLFKIDILDRIKKGGIFLLNTHFSKDDVWSQLPKTVQKQIIDKNVEFYVIDAYELADKTKMGTRINTIMQTCYFKLADVIPLEEALKDIKDAIVKTYSKKGQEVVDNNIAAVDGSLANLFKVDYPKSANSKLSMESKIDSNAPEFVREVTATLIAGKGNTLKTSQVPFDGTFPTDTTKYEKRDVADKISVWHSDKCIQCGQCVFACPHSCLESKQYELEQLQNAPSCFKAIPVAGDKTGEQRFTIQISPEDCTGCSICAISCPVKAISMEHKHKIINDEKENYAFFNTVKGKEVNDPKDIKNAQFKPSLFKYSGACAGCGETPYLGLISKLFGERMIVANATGCSSIYGGNLPTTPWSKSENGRGPAWSNSLFEDNAEFGFGFKLSQEIQINESIDLLLRLKNIIEQGTKEIFGEGLVDEVINNYGKTNDNEIREQIERVEKIKLILSKNNTFDAKHLISIIDALVERSIWIVGGDGWAYDIDFGGLDHILAMNKKVKVLVMDTEVYSNTGGQSSKATPLGASAKFAANGKKTMKKDLGAIAMMYENIYVAQVAVRANPAQTLKAIIEAEAYDGPSIVIAYSSCIAHGVSLEKSFEQQKGFVDSGMWLLYRYNPDLAKEGKNPLIIDSKEPKLDLLEQCLYNETRFSAIKKADPELAARNIEELKTNITKKWKKYSRWASETL
ncbi:MAG: pyruvate:ferredoxin (flavodoxin) oxidoreductase [Rickettsiales bacterium]|jgi:pyruvate-ferredoxin/flavodoxin oxidoreductase|nr:pyruvate:ferredoxin (flavodoxin) oxidoreductase [Rickettsiales bacterium]